MVFCASVAIASVYSSEIPKQPPGTLTHPLALANLASESIGSNSSLGSRLSLTIAFPWLSLTALGPCLPSYFSSLVGNLACKPIVWVLHQKDKGILWLALALTHKKECHPSGHITMTSYLLLMFFFFFINGIQALQHRWKKCVGCNWNYVGK